MPPPIPKKGPETRLGRYVTSKWAVRRIQLARPLPTVAALFPWQGLCYNHRAVERARNQVAPSVRSKRDAEVVSPQTTDTRHDSRQVGVDRSAVAHDQDPNQAAKLERLSPELNTLAPGDDVSRYCPVCWQRLESRRCKLICPECGYYMSCADYY